jgi:uncharacterized membrane protein (UPF0127 family)
LRGLIFVLFFIPNYFAQAEMAASEIIFPKGKIKIQEKIIEIEIASSQEQQERGLMYRTSLSENSGMLFVYDYARPLNFWMKNTFIPLSIAFFDRDQIIIEILDMEPAASIMQSQVSTAKSKAPARYALEMNKGWYKRNNIFPGHKFYWVHSNKDLGLEIPSPPNGSGPAPAK